MLNSVGGSVGYNRNLFLKNIGIVRRIVSIIKVIEERKENNSQDVARIQDNNYVYDQWPKENNLNSNGKC